MITLNNLRLWFINRPEFYGYDGNYHMRWYSRHVWIHLKVPRAFGFVVNWPCEEDCCADNVEYGLRNQTSTKLFDGCVWIARHPFEFTIGRLS
jgi:hypothetical protein